MLREGVPDREVPIRDGGATDRTPVSLVCRDLMDEQFLGVLGRELTVVDGALPHTSGIVVRI